MEFICRTPTTRKLHTCSSPYGSRSKRKRGSRLVKSTIRASGTPDRFIPCHSDDMSCEFSTYQIAKSVEKKNDNKISVPESHSKALFAERRNILPIQRMLTFGNPSPSSTDQTAHSKGYWDKYAMERGSVLKEKRRKIPTVADNVLNAPDVIDDFYLNLLHWGSKGSLAVGLGFTVYLLQPKTLQATPLLSSSNGSFPSAVQWNVSGCGLAVGFSNGELQIWDPEVSKLKDCIKAHSNRIGCLSWHPEDYNIISCGSQSGDVHLYDCRALSVRGTQSFAATAKFRGHSMDVCSMQWSPAGGQFLATGGNDNVVNIWSRYGSWERPTVSFKEHKAAVKALSWCPWKSSMIATGGGTADKTLHLWNILTGKTLRSVKTKSQISGVVWSPQHKELLTAHGYEENALMIWDPETLQDPLAVLQGHSKRILHLAISPDKQQVATVAADETMRIWKCFTCSDGKRSLNFNDGGSCHSNIGSFEKNLLMFGLH